MARQGRDDDIERIGLVCTMRRRVGQRPDDLHLLDERARPAMRDDERQGALVLRADVDEVDVQPIDLGQEVRKGVHRGFEGAPVVVPRPIARQGLRRPEPNALRDVVDVLPLGPAGRLDPATQVVEVRLRGLEAERTDRDSVGPDGGFAAVVATSVIRGLLCESEGRTLSGAASAWPSHVARLAQGRVHGSHSSFAERAYGAGFVVRRRQPYTRLVKGLGGQRVRSRTTKRPRLGAAGWSGGGDDRIRTDE